MRIITCLEVKIHLNGKQTINMIYLKRINTLLRKIYKKYKKIYKSVRDNVSWFLTNMSDLFYKIIYTCHLQIYLYKLRKINKILNLNI